MREEPVLDVSHLTVRYHRERHDGSPAVDDVSFSIAEGETVGVTGASGCGKTTVALAITGLLPTHAEVSGTIRFRGRDLGRLGERELRTIRGAAISIAFQEPGMALNPVMAAGPQVADVVRAHERCSRAEARERATAVMAEVGLGDDLRRIYRAYPHELSGGQAQRIVLAQALVCRPALVIADEPTASLDATVRVEILRLIAELAHRHGSAFFLISHSSPVLAVADRVITMRAGRLVAPAPTPYRAPLRASGGSRHDEADEAPLVAARGVTKSYCQRRLLSRERLSVPALSDVDLRVVPGATLGIVGESGSGKSTLARCLAGLDTPDAGDIRIGGLRISRLQGHALRSARRQVQLIFQDTASALNPRFTAEAIVAEPLVVQGIGTGDEHRKLARALMEQVGLPAARAASRPHEFSGGERQRLAIARALAASPRVLILDEALSGLDAPHQEQILDLLATLRERYRLTYICISHDLSLVARCADHLVVMHQGRIVERGATIAVLNAPSHAHTRALVAAAFQPELAAGLAV